MADRDEFSYCVAHRPQFVGEIFSFLIHFIFFFPEKGKCEEEERPVRAAAQKKNGRSDSKRNKRQKKESALVLILTLWSTFPSSSYYSRARLWRHFCGGDEDDETQKNLERINSMQGRARSSALMACNHKLSQGEWLSKEVSSYSFFRALFWATVGIKRMETVSIC